MQPGWKFVLPGLVLALCLTGGQAIAGLLAPREHNRLLGQLERRPMIFFAAKGPADSCGPGCSEWIAAIGRFDEDASQRFRAFIEKMNGRNLPIFFHSPGGLVKAAIEIGHILRERRMTAGIGRTSTKCRVFDKNAACQNPIMAGESINATLTTSEAQCHSACVSDAPEIIETSWTAPAPYTHIIKLSSLGWNEAVGKLREKCANR